MALKAQVTKEKLNTLDCIKIKVLCFKRHIKKVKRQPIEWEKKIQNMYLNKGFIPIKYKELINEKTN